MAISFALRKPAAPAADASAGRILALARNALRSEAVFVRPLVVAALLAGIMAAPTTAHADGSYAGFARPGKVEWKDGQWDRFTPAEGAFSTLVTVGGIYLDATLPDPFEPKLEFEVPVLDPGVRGLVRARSARVQQVWADWSDVGYRTMGLFPIIMDAGIVALGVHRNPDVAAQLFLIDYEAFSIAALAQQMTSRLTSRPRPFRQDCADDGKSTRYDCGGLRDIRSFYGGHASAAFTAAGLTCLHHQHIPLYGGGAPDAWACVWALSMASMTALGRMTSDEHWASDTIVGVSTGWFFGYVMPKWLHYGTSSSRPTSLVGRILPTTSRDGGMFWVPTFTAVGDGGVIGVRGAL